MLFPKATTSLVDNIEIVVPASFEGILPVSPSRKNFAYEIETYRGFAKVSEKIKDQIIFDVGCNNGVFSALICKKWMPRQVHAFDGNSEALDNAIVLEEANKIDSIQFNQVLVGEKTGIVDFYALPKFAAPASTRNNEIIKFHTNARKISLQMSSIDDYCAKKRVVPSVIKMDIEGGEYAAILGGHKVLSENRPAMIIETHGIEIDGILGSLPEMLNLLTSYGYRSFYDLSTQHETSKEEYLKAFEKHTGHVLIQ